ncbi:MAG: hypothetical protein EOP51_29535, partial [Sphingobacteriales bacterium]
MKKNVLEIATVEFQKNRPLKFLLVFLLFLCSIFSQVSVFAQADLCASAPSISVSTVCAGTTVNVPGSWGTEIANTTTCGGTIFRDGWYQFINGSEARVLTVSATNNRAFGIAVYTGICGGLTQVTGGCDNANANENAVFSFNAAAGQVYYVRIYRTGTASSNVMNGTICIYEYCTGSGSTDDRYGIERVQFNTINNGSDVDQAYQNFTSVSTNVLKGSTYNLNLTLDTRDRTWFFGYTYYNIYASAWIDWNHNGVFDAAEAYNLGSRNTDGALNMNITVPVGALTGSTLMRVRGISVNNSDACGNGDPGEVEDYTLNIIDQNATISTVTPSPVCVGGTITITGTNLSSTSAVSFAGGIPATGFTVLSSSSVTAVVPPGASNGPVTVTTVANAVSGGSLTILAVPGAINVTAATNPACTGTTISATGGTGGTIHYQGTNAAGTTINSLN